MSKKWNVVVMIADTHGHFTNNMDWGTKEGFGLKDSAESLKLMEAGYVKFSNAVSPAVSSIMAIESMMSGIYTAKTHKLHWREWPAWDRFDNPVLGGYLKEYGYEVIGFSGLFNAADWVPSIYCYNPDIYRKFPEYKGDLLSQESVMAAIVDYFTNVYKKEGSKLFIIHSVLMFKIWNRLMDKFFENGLNYNNTIFVLTSDHYIPFNFGRPWLLSERDKTGLFHHTDLTEYNNRILFYMKYPGSEGTEVKTNVAGYDITPTILELLGFLPQWPAKFDGVSLVPLLKGQAIPPRMIRTDNLYPFQIGEKQGRITAIRNGNYKYIYRPDPTSSYIAYRLNESWSFVLGHEEFYDLENDYQEKHNLINEKSESIQEEISKCKEFLQKTNEDIIAFHVETLRKAFRANKLSEKLCKDRRKGNALVIQSSPDIIFMTIVMVIRAEMPEWNIDIVVKVDNQENIIGVCDKIIYRSKYIYQYDDFINAIGSKIHKRYNLIINTSNVPMGDYLAVYDEANYPVGDFIESTKIIRSLDAEVKASLCVNMTFKMIKHFHFMDDISFVKLFSLKRLMKLAIRISRKIFKPLVIKLMKFSHTESPKIKESLSNRIVSSKD